MNQYIKNVESNRHFDDPTTQSMMRQFGIFWSAYRSMPEHTDIAERKQIIKNILRECGEFEPLFSDPDFMADEISDFFERNAYRFDKMIMALQEEYKPLENYNRLEEEYYEDNIETSTTSHEGRRLTTDNIGKTVSTSVDGKHTETRVDGKITTTHVEGLNTETMVEGKRTQTSVEGKRTETEVAGKVTTETLQGKVTTEVEKPDNTSSTTTKPALTTTTHNVAGFDGTGSTSSLHAGSSDSTQIGSGNTYEETTTTKTGSGTSGKYKETLITDGDSDKPSINTVQGDSDNPTSRVSQGDADNPSTVETTGDVNHPTTRTTTGDDSKPTTTSVEGDSTKPTTIETRGYTTDPNKSETYMETPHTTQTGHETGEHDISTTTRNPRTLHARGNIGVTTSQQMLESELHIRKFDIYNEITKCFMHELCIPIYI